MSMKKIILAIIVAIFSCTLAGCLNLQVESIRNDPSVYTSSPVPVEINSIFIIDEKFSPQTIEIKTGETVTFTNLDNVRHLIISDPHPEHNQLPDFYSNYLILNESYKYTFIKSGNFGIHLEDNPSVSAKIIVK